MKIFNSIKDFSNACVIEELSERETFVVLHKPDNYIGYETFEVGICDLPSIGMIYNRDDAIKIAMLFDKSTDPNKEI